MTKHYSYQRGGPTWPVPDPTADALIEAGLAIYREGGLRADYYLAFRAAAEVYLKVHGDASYCDEEEDIAWPTQRAPA